MLYLEKDFCHPSRVSSFFFLLPPVLCRKFSSSLLPTSLCQLPVLAVWAEVSSLGRVGCGISVSACQCNRRRRASGPLSADLHRCRWEVKSSPVTRHWGKVALPSFPPPSPLNLSLTLLRTPLFHSLFRQLSLLCYCSSKEGVGSDKVLGLIDGQSWRLDKRMDEGRGGSLTQANTERQRGMTCLAMQPLTAPQQFSSPLTQCQWTLSLATCLATVHMNDCDSKQRLKECCAHKEEQYTACKQTTRTHYCDLLSKQDGNLTFLTFCFVKKKKSIFHPDIVQTYHRNNFNYVKI